MLRAAADGANSDLSAIGQALGMLGDRWVLLIVQRAFLLRVRTFAGWRDELGISESVLATRLKELVRHGILGTTAYRDGRTRYEYRLTDAGLGLWSFLLAIHSWERDWADRPGLLAPMHDTCGHDARPYLACGTCREPVTARETATDVGPRASFIRIGLPRHHRRTLRSGGRPDYLGYCPHSMEILGDRWSTAVLAAALLGVKRFIDFQSRLGIAPSVLTDRLRRFVEVGVLTPDEGRLYRLTDKGLAFFEVFAFLVDWAHRELPVPEDARITITHRPCATVLRPVLVCRACDGVLERRRVHFDLSGYEPAARRESARDRQEPAAVAPPRVAGCAS
ncbi:HxlR family transcriptional regulator [Sphaerisporangium melleum]|uniref:HxlR family transcriptional regulator n=1 Tax=Sphaerisporangium melleum TaxID=321316 RepID=A0A917RF92_9ACTN|nr:helix-turn-helix domain-containing protein [Sphaerisporangium melleum]GGL05408.1 HxlR family transcriptional regulator [Sphaerisporangium melleum]GII73891.1 HxlR family transcriptional regulator [Sphaerisporangium melleum]